MITVFTATYNRANTIGRLFESLMNQTISDFEWVIVDDGSTDNTEDLVKTFLNRKFDVVYFKSAHLGKHFAVNKGLDICKGDLFFLVDSDDFLPKNSLEIIALNTEKIADSSYCGMSGRMVDMSGKTIGKKQKATYSKKLCDDIKANDVFDRADILKTDVFRRFKYPTFPGEWHIAPGVPFVRMSNAGYKVLFLKDTLYIADYQNNGLTAMKNKKIVENFNGYTLRCRELIHSNIGFKKKIKIKIKYSLLSRLYFATPTSKIATDLGIRKSSVRICIVIGKILRLFRRL